MYSGDTFYYSLENPEYRYINFDIATNEIELVVEKIDISVSEYGWLVDFILVLAIISLMIFFVILVIATVVIIKIIKKKQRR